MMTIRNIGDLKDVLVHLDSVALFSGSFNPPHDAHLKLIGYAVEKYVDSVIVCPHSHNPQKKNELMNINYRIEMLKQIITASKYRYRLNIGLPPVFDGIGQNELNTIELLKKKINPDIKYYILCGSDVIQKDYFDFKRDIPHIVCIRENKNAAATLERIRNILKVNFIIVPHISDISSTDLRNGKLQNNRFDALQV